MRIGKLLLVGVEALYAALGSKRNAASTHRFRRRACGGMNRLSAHHVIPSEGGPMSPRISRIRAEPARMLD
jgi:hypothetical protein